MGRLNVPQPDGGYAIFDTVVDKFVQFDADLRDADSLPWDDAIRYAIGAAMEISGGVQEAIDRGLVTREHCERVLQEFEDEGND